MKTKDGHIFYDPVTKKILTRRSYRRMNGVPPEWLHVRTTDNLIEDDSFQDYDSVSSPAMPNVITVIIFN